MVELVAERGYGGVTVRELSRLAGVSTKTFYECFENVEDSFAATYARIVRDTLRRATESPSGPEGRLRTRIRTFFEVLGEEPKAARLILVDALSAGPALISRTRVSGRALERFVGDELAAAASPVPIQPGIVDGAAAAALHLARSRLLSGCPASSSVIADEFANWLLILRGSASLGGRRDSTAAAAGGRPAPEPTPEIGDDRCFLLAAVTRLSMRDGYANLTVPAICREAGVSRRSFDQHFDGIAGCFLAAVETTIADAVAGAMTQAAAADSWERAVVRAVATLCAEFAREPALARLGVVDILAPGRAGLELRERMIVRWARRLRHTAPADVRPGQLAAEASVAATMGIAATAAAAGRADRIVRAVPSVAFVVLAPAIGPAAAERKIANELRAREREVRKHSTQFP